jgi:hypothetical protein
MTSDILFKGAVLPIETPWAGERRRMHSLLRGLMRPIDKMELGDVQRVTFATQSEVASGNHIVAFDV